MVSLNYSVDILYNYIECVVDSICDLWTYAISFSNISVRGFDIGFGGSDDLNGIL